MRLIMYAFTSVVLMSASYCVGDSFAAKDSAEKESAESTPPSLTHVVATAYADVNQGWSSDEVLLQDELNQQFLKRCRDQMPSGTDNDFNWKLLNIRKAGRLKTNITKRRRDNHAAYKHLAEIAARTIEDKHKTQFDRILCRPQWRAEFDREAQQLAPETDPYLMRKAAMGLRKARHLRPELLLRIADWNREITTHQAADIVKDATRIPATPGVYIFRGPSGYLYIGEAINLRERLKTHLNSSDRQSLANHLKKQDIDTISVEVHAFPKDSRAKQVAVRRAYESQLIASRKPRFNVRP